MSAAPRRPRDPRAGGPLGGPDAPVVVLAGGTGTGKSLLARALGDRGAFVIEADRVGHEMLLCPKVRAALVAYFGGTIIDAAGEIDRKRLGALAFADPAARERLDRIVHPPLVAELRRRIDHLRSSRAVRMVVIDAALWWQFEASTPLPPVDFVVMTTADPQVRQSRIMVRDGIDLVAARARIEAQDAIEASLHRADAVLENSADRASLVAALFGILDERFGLQLGGSSPAAS